MILQALFYSWVILPLCLLPCLASSSGGNMAAVVLEAHPDPFQGRKENISFYVFFRRKEPFPELPLLQLTSLS